MTWVEIWRRGIFKPKGTLKSIQTYRARLRLCCRTSSTVRTTEITYIFLRIRFTCTSCVSIKHPKHPKRIRFTYTFCVQLDVLNAVCFLVYAPLARFTYTFNFPIRIRITYTFNVAAPLTPYTYTFNLYILRIRNTYTYYIYFILTCNTYIFYLHLNVEFPSFFSNFLRKFLLLKIFPKYFAFIFLQNIFTPIFPKIFTPRRLLKFL